jgi:nicotinate-nucleotide--dimethylbenzimidazole phosphoribosyltransferase
MLESVIQSIRPLDEEAMSKCQVRLDNLTKPLGSLHSFEHIARQLAGITRVPRPLNLPAALVIVNGSLRTQGMLDVFADQVGAKVIVYEVDHEFDWNQARVADLLAQGVKIAGSATDTGVRVVGSGMVGAFAPSIVSEILSWYSAGAKEPMNALTIAKSPELAGMVGVILGAAAGGAAVVLDGVETCLAALIAVRIAPQVREYLIGSHIEEGSVHAECLQLLTVPGYLFLGMNIGQGVGAALGISLIRASLHVLNDMKTFGATSVPIAEDGPGALVQNAAVRD